MFAKGFKKTAGAFSKKKKEPKNQKTVFDMGGQLGLVALGEGLGWENE